MLTNERIDEIAGPADYWDRRVFARAIEAAAVEKFLNDSGQYLTNDATREATIAAATAPLLERIAALEATLSASCADEREQLWEATPGGGCSRALDAESKVAALEAKLAQRVPLTGDEWRAVSGGADALRELVAKGYHGDVSTREAEILDGLLSSAPAAPEQHPAECWCETCDLAQGHPMGRTRMSVCPQCGDKRCPRAKHHDAACQAAPEHQDHSEQHLDMVAQSPLQRAIDLNEKASMPWDDAFKLALEEIGIGNYEIDELIGNASPSAIVTMLDSEEVREFVRSVLVHQHALPAQAPNAQQADPDSASKTARGESQETLCADSSQQAAQQAEAQEPCAWMYEDTIGKRQLTFTDQRPIEAAHPHFAKSVPLFTRPQPAQLQALSDEEVRKAVIDCGMSYTAPDLRVAKAIQSALAAKNGVNLK